MNNELHHLAAAYALDALSASERREFEEHYPDCDICAAEVADFREVAATLASGEAAEPPEDLRARTLAEITRTPQLAPLVDAPGTDRNLADQPVADPAPVDQVTTLASRREKNSWSRVGLAAAAAVVLMLGLVTVVTRDNGSSTEELVTASDRVITTLDSVGGQGVLQVVWSAEQDQVAIIGTDLTAIDADQAYALWFVLGDRTVPAALFELDANGDVTQLIDVDDLDPQGWGITIEPETGSPQPTTPILFSGTV